MGDEAKSSEQNKQVLIIVVIVAVLGAFLFFKMATSSKAPSQGGAGSGDMKAENLDPVNVGYVPEGLKDPFKFPREMFKSEDGQTDGTGFFEDEPVGTKAVIELPPMTVKGVVLSDTPTVIIDGKVIKIGESIYDAVVKEISKDKIIVEYKGETFELSTPIMTGSGASFESIPDLPQQQGDTQLPTSQLSGQQGFSSATATQSKVNIAGSVIFDSYKGGPIVVIARAPAVKDIKVTLNAPGPFSISLPANCGNAYLSAINVQENKSLAQLPFGSYAKNPLNVGKDDMSGIEIRLQESQIDKKDKS
jgi:hypothetical protein